MNPGILPANRGTGYFRRIELGPTQSTTTIENHFSMAGDFNDYYGVWVANQNLGTFASTDIVMGNASANVGSAYDPLAYFDIGVNGTNNANPNSTLFAANDAYIFTGGGNIGDINIATGTTGKVVKFGVGGLLTANEVARFTTGGLVMFDGLNIATGTGTGMKIGTATTQKLGFFNKAPVVQQVQGATLTNNVTAGGSANTLANFTSLVTYSTDAATIRNDIYQLGQTLKTVVDALRLYGLLS